MFRQGLCTVPELQTSGGQSAFHHSTGIAIGRDERCVSGAAGGAGAGEAIQGAGRRAVRGGAGLSGTVWNRTGGEGGVGGLRLVQVQVQEVVEVSQDM